MITILAPEVRERSRYEITTLLQMLTDEVAKVIEEEKLIEDRKTPIADILGGEPT